MEKLITYKIPNERYGTDDSEGKTSTVSYNGPDKLICWVINNEDVTRIVDAFAEDELPDRPTPKNYTVVEIDATESDENALRIALIYGGIPSQRQLEVDNGVAELPNPAIADPMHLREVYSLPKAMDNDCINLDTMEWKPLEYRTGDTADRDDASVRTIRDALLHPTDGKIAEDMPESLKQEWLDFRQQLRDLPSLTTNIPNNLIGYPTAPDQPDGLDLIEDLVRIADRTQSDQESIDLQLPDNIT